MAKSLYGQFKDAEGLYPENLAIRFENRTWTYASLAEEIEKCARKLSALGIEPGEPVAVSLPNTPEAVFLFYAINEIGAISYNVHPLTPAPMMKTFLERARARFLFCLANSAHDYRQALDPSIRIIAINPYRRVNPLKALVLRKMSHYGPGIEKYARLKKGPSVKPYVPSDGADAVYLNTGGTNGDPKIVRLSNEAINYLAMQGYPLIGGPVADIRILTAIPLFHGFGLSMGVHTPLSCGASSILVLKFNTKEAIRHIKKGHSTVIIGVPALYNALLSRKAFYGPWLQKQIVAFVGGDTAPQALLDRWNGAMAQYGSSAKLFEGYGLTETVSVANVNHEGAAKKGTVGQPLPGIEECIADPADGRILGPEKMGEILIAGPTLMNGYLGDKNDGSEAFVMKEGRRWFATKDYGSIDQEGYLRFRQRLRRIVKVNGETLCPSDVEDAVLGIEDVFEAYCYGVKDERRGQCFRLAVVIRRGDNITTESKVREECYAAIKEKLPPSHLPDKIIFLDSLPRTQVGKVDAKAFETIDPDSKTA